MQALLRTRSIPRLLANPSFRPLYCQRRWAQVQDVRFHATRQSQERVLDKYREKLDRKAKEEGHGSISDLKEAYMDKIKSLKKQAAVPGATAPLDMGSPPSSVSFASSTTAATPSQSPSPTPSNPASSFPKAAPIKPLSAYLDLAKVSDLPSSQIEPLWRLRHAHKEQSLSFALPTATWKAIVKMARRHPQFVLPLPWEVPAEETGDHVATDESKAPNTAAEIHYLQWNFPTEHAVTVLFTHLAEFKLRGEYSHAHTTVTFHTELAESKGLVLGQGSVLKGRGVSVDEGKWLLMCLQKFYGVQAEQRAERKELLESFTRGDSSFQVEKLLDEAERI